MAFATNQVTLKQSPNPALGFTNRQTNASVNQAYADAYASSDPRMTVKQYDRPGVSRGAGQYSYAAAQGAANFADNAAKAQAIGTSDAYANAGMALDEQARNQDFGMALAGLQEQQSQNSYMNQMRQQQRMIDFGGNVFNQMLGGNILGGLL